MVVDPTLTQNDFLNKEISAVVVVGGGPSGVRTAQELSRSGYHVSLFNAERWKPYNRVKLTPLLAGEAQLGQVYLSDKFPGPGKVDRYDDVAVIGVNRDEKCLLTATNRVVAYDKLVLATGSRAFIPKIPGADLTHVHSFRDFNDTETLLARSVSARNVVVIGGGLLGLEAARGMAKHGASVHVIEHENRLMPRQLDVTAGKVLKERIEAIGLSVLTNHRVASIEGTNQVEGVKLADGTLIDADTVIICTGVRANTQLAEIIGLKFNRGVLVDDHMQTSDPHIYAVGECAEHDGIVQGLVGPCFEQVNAAIAHIKGNENAAYEGSIPATKLKVLGADVFSIGDFESIEQQPGVRSWVYSDEKEGIYRRVFFDRGKIIAALGVGEWPEATKIQQAVSRKQSVPFWKLWSFKRGGSLWGDSDDSAASWPKEAIVCNCTGVTKGAIADAITLGANSIEEVRTATSANTVCGTCAPLVLEILGQGEAKPEPAKWWKWLLGFSAIAGLVALATALLPRIETLDTYIYEPKDFFFQLWFNSLWKQYSGYTLLGLTVAAALIGLRKRIKFLSWAGGYNSWRLIHLGIGIVSAFVLVWHTGFRLGHNLNFYLMMSFLITLIFGAVAGLITGGEHELQERGITGAKDKPRALPLWIHILAIWPLPVLLAIHILSVYTY